MHNFEFLWFLLQSVLWPQCLAQFFPLWTNSTGFSAFERGSCIDVDSSDNVYVTGTVAISLHDQPYNGGNDVALKKYNSKGTRQWTRMRGIASSDVGYGGE